MVEQFQPDGMFDERLMLEEPETIPRFTGEISLASVTLVEDDRIRVIDGVTANLPLDRSVAVVGQSGSGKQELALLMPGWRRRASAASASPAAIWRRCPTPSSAAAWAMPGRCPTSSPRAWATT